MGQALSLQDIARLQTALKYTKVTKERQGSGCFNQCASQEVLQSVLLQIGEDGRPVCIIMYISCLLLTLTSWTMLDSARQQVKDVKLTCTRPWQQSFLSGLTSMEGLLRVRIIQIFQMNVKTDSPSSEEPSWKLCQLCRKTIRSVRSCLRVWFIWIPRCKGWLRRWKHGVCFRGGNDDRLPWFVVPLTLPLIASECFGSGRNLHIFGFGHQDSWLVGNN